MVVMGVIATKTKMLGCTRMAVNTTAVRRIGHLLLTAAEVELKSVRGGLGHYLFQISKVAVTGTTVSRIHIHLAYLHQS